MKTRLALLLCLVGVSSHAQSLGTFTATGGTTIPRQFHTATLLANGRGVCNSIGWKKLRWSWRRGLNPRPSDYKSDALPTELRQRNLILHRRRIDLILKEPARPNRT